MNCSKKIITCHRTVPAFGWMEPESLATPLETSSVIPVVFGLRVEIATCLPLRSSTRNDTYSTILASLEPS